ncbi:hypothetical protein SETIT_2G329600v2 [Setaria italica]|uniref:Uncharacterized protein n=1 Tax=Setaria italica TaxID=4555 RepID=A0A368Q5D1_SETIT|nr:hypothetical protein SETIT_2G329600v2 [Setaria italica]
MAWWRQIPPHLHLAPLIYPHWTAIEDALLHFCTYILQSNVMRSEKIGEERVQFQLYSIEN